MHITPTSAFACSTPACRGNALAVEQRCILAQAAAAMAKSFVLFQASVVVCVYLLLGHYHSSGSFLSGLQVELSAVLALAVAVMAPSLHGSKGKPPLPTALYLIATILALGYARMVLYDELLLLLGYPPSAGALAGSLIIALALAQLPLVQQRYPHSQSAKRLLASVAAIGLLLVILQPPMPDKVNPHATHLQLLH